MASKKSYDKFQFNPEFQESILRFIVTDRSGYKALDLIHPDHFTVLHDAIIAKALITYHRTKKKIPQEKIYLIRELERLFNSRDYARDILEDDKVKILHKVNKIYGSPLKDGEELLSEVAKFKAFCQVKDCIQDFNPNDFGQYEKFSLAVQKAITVENINKPNVGTFLIGGLTQRQNKRKLDPEVIPTPFRQLNVLFNSGKGHDRHNVIVVLAPEKSFKTGFFVNLTKGYLRNRKRILYVDMENGQDSLAIRMEQSMSQHNKKEILSGQYDEKVKKIFRKYRRLGGEVDIKRFPSYTTSALDIEQYAQKQKREFGIDYQICIVDYPSVMAAISGSKEDNQRISDVYLDLKNLCERMDWDVLWGAAHVTREARKRLPTKFEAGDTAKCIDINRHVDLMLGLNQNDNERAQGVMRMELIQQRDGVESGAVFFQIKKDQQYMREFTKSELADYHAAVKEFTKAKIGNEDI